MPFSSAAWLSCPLLLVLTLQMSQTTLGQDTFKRVGSNSPLRGKLFEKSPGAVDVRRDLLSVQSPISGSTLTAPDSARHTAIKDPISGATLQLSSNQAQIVAPVLRQEQVHSRNFYLRNDVDITIATLRKNNAINRYTNEKIGTAGTATGLAQELVTGGQLRCNSGSPNQHSKQPERHQQQVQQQQHHHHTEQHRQQQDHTDEDCQQEEEGLGKEKPEGQADDL